MPDLEVDPAAPDEAGAHQNTEHHKNPSKNRPFRFSFVRRWLRHRAHLDSQRCNTMTISCVGIAPFAQNFPAAVSKREIDNGSRQGAAGGATVNDERNAVADLVANAGRMSTLRRALQIGGRGRDGQAEMVDDGAWNRGVRDTQGDVAGVGRGAQRQLGTGTDNDGERSGPESVGEFVEHRVGVACQLVGLRERGNQQRERLMLLTAFNAVDVFDGVEVDGVYGKAIKSVGGHRDNIALAKTGDNVVNPVWLGLVGMDAQDFRGQEGLPQFPQAIRDCRLSWQPQADRTHAKALDPTPKKRAQTSLKQLRTPQRRKLSQHRPRCKLSTAVNSATSRKTA